MSFLDVIVDLLSFDFLDWYSQQFIFLPRNTLEFLVSWFIYYIIIQLLTYILPFLRNLLYFFGAPFRYVHVWLHIWAAQRLQQKKVVNSLENYNIYPEETSLLLEREPPQEKTAKPSHTLVKSAFLTGIGSQDSSKVLIREPKNGREAFSIAAAPLLGAIPLFIFLVLTADYFASMDSFGIIFHSYLSTVTLGVSMPTARDMQFYTNTSLVESRISPPYVIWVYAVFMINLYLEVSKTEDLLIGIFSGFVYSFIYLGLLFAVVRFVAPSPKYRKKDEEFTIFRPLGDQSLLDRNQQEESSRIREIRAEILLMSEGDDIY